MRRPVTPSEASLIRLAMWANFVAAGLVAAWAGVIGVLLLSGVRAAPSDTHDIRFRAFLAIGTIGVGLLCGAAVLHTFVGACIAKRQRRRMAITAAALTAVNPTCVPVGVGVGVLSLYILTRPSVSAQFGENHEAAQQGVEADEA